MADWEGTETGHRGQIYDDAMKNYIQVSVCVCLLYTSSVCASDLRESGCSQFSSTAGHDEVLLCSRSSKEAVALLRHPRTGFACST